MAGSASYQKAMGGISPARPTSPRQKARITTSELRRRGNSELASAQLPPYQSPTGWICGQTLLVARRVILTFAQNTRCLLCANSSRSSESKATTLAHGPQRILRSGVAAISAIMAPTWSIIRSTNPDGALGVHSSTALPVTTLCGRGAHIAEPDITLDKLPRPQSGFAEAAAAGSFEPNDVPVF